MVSRKSIALILILLCCFSHGLSQASTPEEKWKDIPEETRLALFQAQQEMESSNFEQAIKILTRFQKVHSRRNHFLVEFSIGTAYALMDKPHEALPYLERAAQMEQDYSPVWRNLGKIYYDAQEYQKSGEALERSFRLETNKNPEVLYLAMAAFYQAGDLKSTVALGEELMLKFRKNDSDVLGLLINAYIRTEDFDGAIETLKKLQRVSSDDPKLWKLLAQLYVNTQQYESATIAYEIYGYLTGFERDDFWVMGDLFAMIGVPKRATQYYTQALQDGGSDEEFEKLASAYYCAYEFDHAIEALDAALNQKATVERLILKAQLAYLQDRFDEAQQWYAQAAGIHTDDGYEWLMAGYCAMRSGNKEKARQWLTESAKFPQQQNEAKHLLDMLISKEEAREDHLEDTAMDAT